MTVIWCRLKDLNKQLVSDRDPPRHATHANNIITRASILCHSYNGHIRRHPSCLICTLPTQHPQFFVGLDTVSSYGVIRPNTTLARSFHQQNYHRLSEVLSSTHSLTHCVQPPLCCVGGLAAALPLSRECLIPSPSPPLPLCPSPSLLFDLMPLLP